MKTKCEVCKCLNLIVEGKKHPSQTVWNILLRKYSLIRQKDQKSIASFCDNHRLPMNLIYDLQSIDSFIREVFTTVERYLEGVEGRLEGI